MLLTFESITANLPLVALAFILGGLLLIIPNKLLGKKNPLLFILLPVVIFIPFTVLFVLGLGDTGWSIFPRVLIGALGMSFALGGGLAAVVAKLMTNQSKGAE